MSLAIVMLAGCQSESFEDSRPGPTVMDPTSDTADRAWLTPDRAKDFIGRTAAVCGDVAGIRRDGKAVFINMGADYPDPDRFTVVIFEGADDWTLPEAGEFACVREKIVSYKGLPQVHLTDESQFGHSGDLNGPGADLDLGDETY